MNASGILLVVKQGGAILVFILMLYLIQKLMMNLSPINENGRSLLARVKSLRNQAYQRSAALLGTLEYASESDREEAYEKSKEKMTSEVSLGYRFGEALKGKTSNGLSQGEMRA